MKRRREEPLTQTRISSFFTKGAAKKPCKNAVATSAQKENSVVVIDLDDVNCIVSPKKRNLSPLKPSNDVPEILGVDFNLGSPFVEDRGTKVSPRKHAQKDLVDLFKPKETKLVHEKSSNCQFVDFDFGSPFVEDKRTKQTQKVLIENEPTSSKQNSVFDKYSVVAVNVRQNSELDSGFSVNNSSPPKSNSHFVDFDFSSPFVENKAPIFSPKKQASKNLINVFESTEPSKRKKPIASSKDITDYIRLPNENVLDKNVDADSGLSIATEKKSSPTKLRTPLKNDNFVDEFQDFGFDELSWNAEPFTEVKKLDFTGGKKCEVVSVESNGSAAVVKLRDTQTNEEGPLLLKDMWSLNVDLGKDDVVFVEADKVAGDWQVDAQQGFISIDPDNLVSSTSLVGAMFCLRKAVLSSVFKGLDSDSKIMSMGSFVHDLFQKCLKDPKCTEENVRRIIDEILEDPPSLRMLYSSGFTVDEAKKEMDQFVPFIMSFLKTYVTQENKVVGDNYMGKISDIIDIEENVQNRRVGIKGRVDVTVKVRSPTGCTSVKPLELKTGRASMSREHQWQVLMYTMMMDRVDSGLLLYLKEGILKELKPTRLDTRDIVLLRNQYVKACKGFKKLILPEPIRFLNACRKCPYSRVCTAYLDETVSESHPLRELNFSLNENHSEYFWKWSRLLLLEDDTEGTDKNELKLSNVVLEDGVVRLKKDFKYSFKKNDAETGLEVGNMVVLMPNGGEKNYVGRIVHITFDKCSVVLDKPLVDRPGAIFEIAGFRSSSLSRYMSNLGLLLEEKNAGLREIIIDQKPSELLPKIAKSILTKECLQILSKLNEEQGTAVLKSLFCKNYLLIEGPPGTGKTQTIVALLKVLLLLKKSVLLVGHTHSSVDNILLRLRDVPFVRMGAPSSINPLLIEKTYHKLLENVSSFTKLENILNAPIIGSTCLGLDSDIIANRKFDFCIVDESSQVLQPEAVKALMAAEKFILVGDPKQLKPVVRNREAMKLGMGESIFERLHAPGNFITLRSQYRMNQVIMDLANGLSYDGILKSGSAKISNRCIELKTYGSPWMRKILSPDLNDSVIFVDTQNYLKSHPDAEFMCKNPIEGNIVKMIVKSVIAGGMSGKDVGVMAPFRAQIKFLKSFLSVEVNTIDQYQGRDKEFIVISCTRQCMKNGDEGGENELLNDFRRLTVAVTRAKRKLIIVGDKACLIRYKPFQKLFSILHDCNFVILQEGCDAFSWDIFCN